MPAASTTLRALALSVIASLSVTGCQALDDAGRAIGRADLVNDLAARLDRALELTYSADYQLSGGRTASIAQGQDPARSAYTWPGGRLTVTAEATTRCETGGARTVCTLLAPPATTAKPSVALFTEANQRGLVTPPVVLGLLTEAALDPEAVVAQNDTTLAGHHATCLEVQRSAGDFTACVTTEGVLGSFTGKLDDRPVELALTRYSDTVDGASFALPAGAGVVDRRSVSS
ncbi:hypothetical protein C5N14_24735 [Micromonospora sp. MW-13]|uniref:hypothetical protein n=1 Tax=unclassified Micromonospora TaxID=2617518 RepID=UPI000E443A97|nr:MULTISPECIES: hypothetical protein [unclassified Micromonospora]MCX4474339.1 hypothetical protein [Micromonospora sp. NBC_01655]RGC66188.1 hypothetical protein C5N14_24735 [Micromonospora sp. MW-13]